MHKRIDEEEGKKKREVARVREKERTVAEVGGGVMRGGGFARLTHVNWALLGPTDALAWFDRARVTC